MDSGLFILLPDNVKLPNLQRYQKKHYWGAEESLDDEISYKWNDKIIFKESFITDYEYQFLPTQFKKNNYRVIQCSELILNDIISDCYHSKCENVDLIPIIKDILNATDSWSLIFIEDYDDSIEDVLNCTVDKAIEKLLATLDWNVKRKGFLAVSEYDLMKNMT